MTTHLRERCEESIKLEQTMSALYRLYSTHCTEDAKFWWQLHLEEDDHASILAALYKSHLPYGWFPAELLPLDLEALLETSRRATAGLQSAMNAPLPEAEAYRFAVDIEESIGESVLQDAIAKPTVSSIMQLVQNVIGESKGHAARIRKLIADKGC